MLHDSETVSGAIVKKAIQQGIRRLSVLQKDPILPILSKLSSHHLVDLQPSLYRYTTHTETIPPSQSLSDAALT